MGLSLSLFLSPLSPSLSKLYRHTDTWLYINALFVHTLFIILCLVSIYLYLSLCLSFKKISGAESWHQKSKKERFEANQSRDKKADTSQFWSFSASSAVDFMVCLHAFLSSITVCLLFRSHLWSFVSRGLSLSLSSNLLTKYYSLILSASHPPNLSYLSIYLSNFLFSIYFLSISPSVRQSICTPKSNAYIFLDLSFRWKSQWRRMTIARSSSFKILISSPSDPVKERQGWILTCDESSSSILAVLLR